MSNDLCVNDNRRMNIKQSQICGISELQFLFNSDVLPRLLGKDLTIKKSQFPLPRFTLSETQGMKVSSCFMAHSMFPRLDWNNLPAIISGWCYCYHWGKYFKKERWEKLKNKLKLNLNNKKFTSGLDYRSAIISGWCYCYHWGKYFKKREMGKT